MCFNLLVWILGGEVLMCVLLLMNLGVIIRDLLRSRVSEDLGRLSVRLLNLGLHNEMMLILNDQTKVLSL